MNRTLALLALVLGIGVAVGALVVARPGHAPAGQAGTRDAAGPVAEVDRITALERALDEEAALRRELELRLAERWLGPELFARVMEQRRARGLD